MRMRIAVILPSLAIFLSGCAGPRPAEPEELVSRLPDCDLTDHESAQLARADSLGIAGEFSAALAENAVLIREAPDCSVLRVRRGDLLAMAGRERDAAMAYDAALEREPCVHGARAGRVRGRLPRGGLSHGLLAELGAELTEALERCPYDAPLWRLLWRVRLLDGDRVGSRAALDGLGDAALGPGWAAALELARNLIRPCRRERSTSAARRSRPTPCYSRWWRPVDGQTFSWSNPSCSTNPARSWRTSPRGSPSISAPARSGDWSRAGPGRSVAVSRCASRWCDRSSPRPVIASASPPRGASRWSMTCAPSSRWRDCISRSGTHAAGVAVEKAAAHLLGADLTALEEWSIAAASRSAGLRVQSLRERSELTRLLDRYPETGLKVAAAALREGRTTLGNELLTFTERTAALTGARQRIGERLAAIRAHASLP